MSLSSIDTHIIVQSQIKDKFILQYCEFTLRTIVAQRRTRGPAHQAARRGVKTHIYGQLHTQLRTNYGLECAQEVFTKFAHTPTSPSHIRTAILHSNTHSQFVHRSPSATNWLSDRGARTGGLTGSLGALILWLI